MCSGFQQASKRFGVPGSIVPDAVDKQAGSAVNAVLDSCNEIASDSVGVDMALQFLAEALNIQVHFPCVDDQILGLKRILALEEQRMHFPEFPLRSGGFSRLRRFLCVMMNPRKRIVPVHDPQPSGEILLQVAKNQI